MSNKTSIAKLQQYYLQQAFTKQLKQREQISNQNAAPHSNESNGFTLIEMIVVVVIIGVLSAIAAPGWLAFTNRQRINKANDAVLSALQTAQTEAKRTKLSYSASFKTDPVNQIPLVAIYQTNVDPDLLNPSPWKKLGENLDIKPRQIEVCSNIDQDQLKSNKTTTTISCNVPTKSTITFNYQGILPQGSDTGLKIGVHIPNTGTKRCVVVQTLLGSLKIPDDLSSCPSP